MPIKRSKSWNLVWTSLWFFTDIQMPGSMDGLKLVLAVRGRWPPIKIVATSGHVGVRETDLPDGGKFLPKPYSPMQVTGVLRELTGGG